MDNKYLVYYSIHEKTDCWTCYAINEENAKGKCRDKKPDCIVSNVYLINKGFKDV